MNAATLRATRELVGLSQGAVADGLGVSVRSVKNWEGGVHAVPSSVEAWILERASEFDRSVARAVNSITAMVDSEFSVFGFDGDVRPTIGIAYWRTQAEYDASGTGSENFGTVNARNRSVAGTLRSLGYRVEFSYVADLASKVPPVRILSGTEAE